MNRSIIYAKKMLSIKRCVLLAFVIPVLIPVSELSDIVETGGSHHIRQKPDFIDRKLTDSSYHIEEGQDLQIVCNVSVPQGHLVSWRNSDGTFHQAGRLLSISKITRNYTGRYICKEVTNTITIGSNISNDKAAGPANETIFIDVFYPAKILRTSANETQLAEKETFVLNIQVEGNPIPYTTFKSDKDDQVVFRAQQEGNLTISMTVQCDDMGEYLLSCKNEENTDTWKENIIVLCAPKQNPNYHINGTTRPRLGETSILSMESIGYPQPNYTWWYLGKQLLNHKDGGYSSVLTIEKVGVDDYGSYTILMQNQVGYFTYVYNVQAFGPPSPVTNLQLLNVTTNSVTLSWFSGFDYDDHQSYTVMNNGAPFKTVDDTSGGHGMTTVIVVIDNLTSITSYSFRVQSKNGRGTSSATSNSVTLTTSGAPAPDPKYPIIGTVKPRLGETITLSMNSIGYPQPNYTWWYQGKQLLDHKDGGYSSVLTVGNIGVDDYGTYTILMQNIAGYITYVYTIQAYGPPSPVTNLQLLNVTTNSVTLSWFSGFDYDDHQSYTVMNNGAPFKTVDDTSGGHGMATVIVVIDNLTSITSYSFSVQSKNGRGTSSATSNSVTLTTSGAPAPDPKYPIIGTVKPRLDETITLSMNSIGYPQPNYTWWYQGKQLLDHKDGGYSSVLTVGNIGVDDYGTYTILMQNIAGYITYVYTIQAYGPPDPVSKLQVLSVSTDSATLSWFSGFDYDDHQTYTILKNGAAFMTVDDTSGGHGLATVTHVINNLASSTYFSLCLQSANSRGMSSVTSNIITFTTKDIPRPKNGGPGKTSTIRHGIIFACIVSLMIF